MNIFTAVKYCCILHGRVFVMTSLNLTCSIIIRSTKNATFLRPFPCSMYYIYSLFSSAIMCNVSFIFSKLSVSPAKMEGVLNDRFLI